MFSKVVFLNQFSGWYEPSYQMVSTWCLLISVWNLFFDTRNVKNPPCVTRLTFMHCDQYDVLLSSRPNELQGFCCICFLQKILLIETVFTLVWNELSDGFYVVLINQCLELFFRHTHCQKSTLSDVKSLFHVRLENSEKVFIKCSTDNAWGQVTWSDGMQCADAVLLSCCIAVLATYFWLLVST